MGRGRRTDAGPARVRWSVQCQTVDTPGRALREGCEEPGWPHPSKRSRAIATTKTGLLVRGAPDDGVRRCDSAETSPTDDGSTWLATRLELRSGCRSWRQGFASVSVSVSVSVSASESRQGILFIRREILLSSWMALIKGDGRGGRGGG